LYELPLTGTTRRAARVARMTWNDVIAIGASNIWCLQVKTAANYLSSLGE
jgi:hypothetical protein